MKCLIELYDDRAIENVLAVETFLPEKVIYLCPPEIAQNKYEQQKMINYFRYRGLNIEIRFYETSFYKTDKIIHQLNKIYQEHADCVLDITGGTDASLFAAGIFCKESAIPTLTYSRRNNRFFNICNAEFADIPCLLEYRVEDFFRMVGGTLRKGRVDNSILSAYMHCFDPFFQIFMKYRNKWVDAITFFQKISKTDKEGETSLRVIGSCTQKGEHGGRVHADPMLFRDLEEIGFLKQVQFLEEDQISFSFADEQIRSWLRDVGSVLELYVYKACVDADIFGDVISSAIVDWDGYVGHDSVSNEIDVVASRGCVPIFISCKACEIRTSAINELAILRDRFGGKGAKAAIVTTEFCNAAARHRAAQLGIAVIDREEMENNTVVRRLKVIMKAESEI